jgi:hypothetical protein
MVPETVAQMIVACAAGRRDRDAGKPIVIS